MKLVRLTERLWYYPYEFDRDRPNLGYIKGDNWSLADKGYETITGMLKPFFLTPAEGARLVRLENYVD